MMNNGNLGMNKPRKCTRSRTRTHAGARARGDGKAAMVHMVHMVQ